MHIAGCIYIYSVMRFQGEAYVHATRGPVVYLDTDLFTNDITDRIHDK